MKLGSFDTFFHETKESGRKKCRSASRSEILIVKVDDYLGNLSYRRAGGLRLDTNRLNTSHSQHLNSGKPLARSHRLL